jgi:hypothetical protein
MYRNTNQLKGRMEDIMTLTRKKGIAGTIVAAAGIIVLVTQIGASGSGAGAMKLEGAWVSRVTSIEGIAGKYPFQWSFILAPDASGRRATLHGSVDVGFGQGTDTGSDFATPLLGEFIMTGPDTAAFNSYWYGVKTGKPDQIVSIGRSWGETKSTGPGKSETTYHFEIYPANADNDRDGFPDAGAVPIKQFTVTSEDTRIPPPER